MKFRTFLMFACMTIVPMIAMFSHKIPNEMRTACKKILLAPINYFSGMILYQSAAADTTLELTNFNEAPNMPLLVKGKKPLEKPAFSDIPTGSFTEQHQQQAQASTTVLRDKLITSGVHRLIIKPATDRNNWYHGSCRLSVDAEGELQRLFHAHASSESAVLESLFQQACRWQEKRPLNVATKPAVNLLRN
ncbi:MAG: hypothetical protein HOK57_09545 [Planctomycetaceae bacterium]|jgi:hypothetical protein|nr:hypothetical protein [Planctomycetaceae bacterium]MBT6460057.1 hypothetical protein [Planctomycetaceae bacterium]MBT7727449.1 hypothetical protein [Planctomycetaceae bacterium]